MAGQSLMCASYKEHLAKLIWGDDTVCEHLLSAGKILTGGGHNDAVLIVGHTKYVHVYHWVLLLNNRTPTLSTFPVYQSPINTSISFNVASLVTSYPWTLNMSCCSWGTFDKVSRLETPNSSKQFHENAAWLRLSDPHTYCVCKFALLSVVTEFYNLSTFL